MDGNHDFAMGRCDYARCGQRWYGRKCGGSVENLSKEECKQGSHCWTRTQHLVLAQWVCLSSSGASGEDDLGGMLYSLGVFIIGLGCTGRLVKENGMLAIDLAPLSDLVANV